MPVHVLAPSDEVLMAAPSATVPTQVATPTPLPSLQLKSAITVLFRATELFATGAVMVICGAAVSLLMSVLCRAGLALGPLVAGDHILTFHLDGASPFFRRVTLELRIDDVTRSYHVPLLLAPYGISSYRGS